MMRYGPYVNLMQFAFICALAIIAILILPITFSPLVSGSGIFAMLVVAGISFALLFIVVSFVLGNFMAYSADDVGISISNLVTRSRQTIPYGSVGLVESRVEEGYRMGVARDFKIAISHKGGKSYLYFPTKKQKDYAEFMKLIREKIGNDKVNSS